ncbi:gastric triacylglycerol lipase-like [Choristoneura fumiferana]|uniref:gastric triacylglycerol lipase-like n=1 Tax=Choristoneura fumiferana TaxID=7141 RepID=UPI003D15B24E
MHRILPGENCARKKPVLLMHGLLQSSEDFMSSGPFAPGFVIAEQCYDVWCGNVRGNSNSLRHTSLNPDKDLEFWKFSFDDMGLYDIPAMVDYVLEQTSAKKLIYIGFSQGGGTFFIMNSEKPEYAEKIGLFIGLSPSTRNLYSKSLVFRGLSEGVQTFRAELETVGIWEIGRRGSLATGALNVLCQNKLVAAILCEAITSALDAPHLESVTPEIERRIWKYFPAGTSVTNYEKYGQALKSEKFLKMDHGPEKNQELYGSTKPPEYNFEASTVPTVIFHGLSDNIVDTKDVEWFLPKLPNVLDYIQVEDPLWNHLDMTYSRFWNETIFSPMKKYMAQYDSI